MSMSCGTLPGRPPVLFPRLLRPCHGTSALLPSKLVQLVHSHHFMEIRSSAFLLLFLLVAEELLHIKVETRHSEGSHLPEGNFESLNRKWMMNWRTSSVLYRGKKLHRRSRKTPGMFSNCLPTMHLGSPTCVTDR